MAFTLLRYAASQQKRYIQVLQIILDDDILIPKTTELDNPP
jgi:hypothetical protein